MGVEEEQLEPKANPYDEEALMVSTERPDGRYPTVDQPAEATLAEGCPQGFAVLQGEIRCGCLRYLLRVQRLTIRLEILGSPVTL